MRFNPISVSTTKIELYFYDVYLASATGFFYRFGRDAALVTNWHVLAGRNAITGVAMDQRGFKPNIVKLSLNLFHKNSGSIEFRSAEIPLYKNGQPLWWQHNFWNRKDGRKSIIDIAVVNLPDAIDNYEEFGENIITLPAHMIVHPAKNEEDWITEHGVPRVSSEVFILGFPNGFGKETVFPIWKRGSIASEPLYYNPDGEPVILVDSLTRSGMSGSPVLYFGNEVLSESGVPVNVESTDGTPWLVGVYAGRDGATNEELGMALSRVWRREVLDQIFFDQCPGGAFPD